MLPPLLMYLNVGQPGARRVRLWLPLFLVWLLLLPLVVLALALTILADVVLTLAGQDYHSYTLLLLGLLGLVADLRGMTVKIHSDDTNVDIEFV